MNDDNPIDPKTVEKYITHPLEELFDIEEGSTVVAVPEPRDTHLVSTPAYDTKDSEIEENFQEVYDKAMDAFDDLQNSAEGIEGKYKARNTEVSVMMLTAALNAAKEKSRMKEHKDKLTGKTNLPTNPSSTTTNNTLVNVVTSDIIRQMADQKSPVHNQTEEDGEGEIIDQEPTKPVRKMQPKKTPPDSGS